MTRRPRLRLPAGLADALALEGGERPLAWATDRAGEWYVGTDRALYLPTPGGFRRLRWEQVERAEWQQETETLLVVEVDEWGRDERRTVVEVADPGRLLELLQERVTKSVLATTYVPLQGRSGLTVVARRSPTGRGPVSWSYVLSRGLDPADPQVRAVAQRARRDAETELGELA